MGSKSRQGQGPVKDLGHAASTSNFRAIFNMSVMLGMICFAIACLCVLILHLGLDHILTLTFIGSILSLSLIGMFCTLIMCGYVHCLIERDLRIDKFDEENSELTLL